MAHPTVSNQPVATSRSSRSRSPTRSSATTRKSRASRSPVPPNSRPSLSPLRKQGSLTKQNSFANLARSLSPCRPSSSRSSRTTTPMSALERATLAPTNNSFLKYCQVHGHQVSQPELQKGGSVPLNRCSLNSSSSHSMSSFGNSFSNGMDGSCSSHNDSKTSSGGFASHLEFKLSSAADHAAGWLDSWKGIGGGSDHCSPGNRPSPYVQQHPLGRHAVTLQYSQGDMLNVAMDDQTFRQLQVGLRKRGVITNNYLRENMHFYVQHIKKVELKKQQKEREQQQQQQQRRTRSPMGRNAAA